MRLMKPRPLKFSDVLHSTPTPARAAKARQQVVQRRVGLRGHGLHARRAVDVRDRAQLAAAARVRK